MSKREKQAAKAAAQGPEAFDRWFAARYGDRWPALRAAMLAAEGQVARINAFAQPEAVEQLLGALAPASVAHCRAGAALPPPRALRSPPPDDRPPPSLPSRAFRTLRGLDVLGMLRPSP